MPFPNVTLPSVWDIPVAVECDSKPVFEHRVEPAACPARRLSAFHRSFHGCMAEQHARRGGRAICQNLNPVIHADYLGLGGDFVFVDTQGAEDPTYDGLGDRFVLTFTGAS